MKKGGICFLVCVLFVVEMIGTVSGFPVGDTAFQSLKSGKTLYVGGDGPGNYSTIQEAVYAAVFGDTVFVYNGVYHEKVKINTSITLIGEDKNTTIIDGQPYGSVVYIHSIGVTMKGFTIKNSSGSQTAGIWLYHSYFTNISDTIMKDNDESDIYLDSSCFNTIEGNIISEGINAYSRSDFNKITNNIISSHDGVGINFFSRVKCNVICQNVIINSEYGLHLAMYCNNNIVTQNTFSNNDVGMKLVASVRNLIVKNNFLNNQQDVTFYYTDPPQNNIFLRNYWNGSLSLPKIIYGERHAFYTIRDDFWQSIEEFDWLPAQEPYVIPEVR
jgi:parallel beta-helix repeat protein